MIHTDFGSEVGITFGNVESRGGSTLTLEVKLGLPLAMLILGGSALTLEVKLGLPLAMLIRGGHPQ